MTVLGLGFDAGVSSDPADPAEEMRPWHEEVHPGHAGIGRGGHTSTEMNEMYAQMSVRLSQEDRALPDRMHDSCSGHNDERNER